MFKYLSVISSHTRPRYCILYVHSLKFIIQLKFKTTKWSRLPQPINWPSALVCGYERLNAIIHSITTDYIYAEAEFLDVIGTKVLRVFLLDIHSHLCQRILFPALSKSGLKLVCNVNSVNRHLKPENSQDYSQKPQRNCAFMNSASVQRITGWDLVECTCRIECQPARFSVTFQQLLALNFPYFYISKSCFRCIFHCSYFPWTNKI